MCEKIVEVLKKPLSTLSIKVPFSNNLESLINRDFKLISQREAYDTLRYLLNCCGKVLELDDSSFTDLRWKSADPDNKRGIEKCKRYVIDSIKDLSKENKVPMPYLKMSDLPLPYSTIYFSTCLALANYALSFQLGNHGLYFWPRSEAYESIKMLQSNIKEEECHEFEIKQAKLLNEIKILEDVLSKVKEKQTKIDSLLNNEVGKCKYSCPLQNESERYRILTSWKTETDELHKSNLEKIKTLEDLNEQLLLLLEKLMVKKEKFIISGDELRKNIHSEVENFAEMNGLSLIKENHLDIPALFKIVHLSIPKAINSTELLRELFSLKLPVIDTGLLSKLENLKKKLEEKCEDIHRQFGEDVKTEASTWLDRFLVTIPKVEFSEQNTTVSLRDPVFDEEMLLHLIECEESSQSKDNQMSGVSKSKRDHKKLRRSVSLSNLPTLPAASPCGSEASKKLCSTPKEDRNRSSFMYDRNISPISVHFAKDKSYTSKTRVPEIGVTNDSILTESVLHTSLLNSYLSADLDYKSQNKQDTFDFTNSATNISLDSTPSGISINLSTECNLKANIMVIKIFYDI